MEKYRVIKKIGTGTCGSAYLVCLKARESEQFVLKKIPLDRASEQERQQAETEVRLLASLDHPLVLGYVDHFMYKGHLCIVTEYCEAGDLHACLQARSTALPEPQILEWLAQLALALAHIHGNAIMHRDLKTQNIFLTREGSIKLGDFGIARTLSSGMELASTIVGTPYYMSPEILSSRSYDFKTDIWSLGCCVYEMMSLTHAFDAQDMTSLVLMILRGEHLPVPQQFSPELREGVKLMLCKNPRGRPSAEQLLKLPFLKDSVARGRERVAALEAARAARLQRLAQPMGSAVANRLRSARQRASIAGPGAGLVAEEKVLDRELESAVERLRSIQRERDTVREQVSALHVEPQLAAYSFQSPPRAKEGPNSGGAGDTAPPQDDGSGLGSRPYTMQLGPGLPVRSLRRNASRQVSISGGEPGPYPSGLDRVSLAGGLNEVEEDPGQAASEACFRSGLRASRAGSFVAALESQLSSWLRPAPAPSLVQLGVAPPNDVASSQGQVSAHIYEEDAATALERHRELRHLKGSSYMPPAALAALAAPAAVMMAGDLEAKARRDARRAEDVKRREAELLEARRQYFEERKAAEARSRRLYRPSDMAAGTGGVAPGAYDGAAARGASVSFPLQDYGGGGQEAEPRRQLRRISSVAASYDGAVSASFRRHGSVLGVCGEDAAEDLEQELTVGGTGGQLEASYALPRATFSNGPLADRISALRALCVQNLGQGLFDAVHQSIASRYSEHSDGERIQLEVQQALGPQRLQYGRLVDQLIYFEQLIEREGRT